MEKVLVNAFDVGLPRPVEGALKRHVGRSKAVVIEQEEWRNPNLSAAEPRGCIGIFGSQDTERAAKLHELIVFVAAAATVHFARQRPKIVVAGRPDNLAEPGRQHPQREFEVGNCFPDVATQDQPVIWARDDLGEDASVLLVPQMEITDRIKPHELAASG
jgi:hypothetical protein